MIRKVNILLAVAFVAMLCAKGLKDLSASRAATKAETSAPAAAKGVSALVPHVYYANWPRFCVENSIANRNGVLLDTMRAIFPEAEFRHLRGSVTEFAKALREDPFAVVVGFGRHRDLEGAGVVSDIPIAYSKLTVMTLRKNPWRYKGHESLAGLRIVTNGNFLDFPLVRSIIKAQQDGAGDGLPTVTVVQPELGSREELARLVESGEADAFFETFVRNGFLPELMSTTIVQRFRMAGEIDRGDVLLHVSNLDPAFCAAVMEEYAKGMRRIEASGERRRIFDYYGMVPAPLKEAPVER